MYRGSLCAPRSAPPRQRSASHDLNRRGQDVVHPSHCMGPFLRPGERQAEAFGVSFSLDADRGNASSTVIHNPNARLALSEQRRRLPVHEHRCAMLTAVCGRVCWQQCSLSQNRLVPQVATRLFLYFCHQVGASHQPLSKKTIPHQASWCRLLQERDPVLGGAPRRHYYRRRDWQRQDDTDPSVPAGGRLVCRCAVFAQLPEH